MTQTPLDNLLENGDGILQSVITTYLIPASMFSIAVYDVRYINSINSILNLRATGKNILNAIEDKRCIALMKKLINTSQKVFSLKERLELLDESLTLWKVIDIYDRKLTVLDINSHIDVLARFPLRIPWGKSVSPYEVPNWYDAKVIKRTMTKINVHFIAWNKKWNQWINIEEFQTRVAERGEKIYIHGKQLKVGNRVDCMTDRGGLWREGTIIGISNKTATVKCEIRRGGQSDPITPHTYRGYDTIEVPLHMHVPHSIYPSTYRIKEFGSRSRGLAYNTSLRL